jgi:hypothetical protein
MTFTTPVVSSKIWQSYVIISETQNANLPHRPFSLTSRNTDQHISKCFIVGDKTNEIFLHRTEIFAISLYYIRHAGLCPKCEWHTQSRVHMYVHMHKRHKEATADKDQENYLGGRG